MDENTTTEPSTEGLAGLLPGASAEPTEPAKATVTDIATKQGVRPATAGKKSYAAVPKGSSAVKGGATKAPAKAKATPKAKAPAKPKAAKPAAKTAKAPAKAKLATGSKVVRSASTVSKDGTAKCECCRKTLPVAKFPTRRLADGTQERDTRRCRECGKAGKAIPSVEAAKVKAAKEAAAAKAKAAKAAKVAKAAPKA